jgi:hypothetical protein
MTRQARIHVGDKEGEATMLTEPEVQEKLAVLPGARVTEQAILARLAKVEFVTHGVTTLCVLTLDNGFRVIGDSTPASPENYRPDIGKHYAYKNGFQQLWKFFGFALLERAYQATRATAAPGPA